MSVWRRRMWKLQARGKNLTIGRATGARPPRTPRISIKCMPARSPRSIALVRKSPRPSSGEFATRKREVSEKSPERFRTAAASYGAANGAGARGRGGGLETVWPMVMI